MTFQVWFDKISSLDHKSTEAKTLMTQYPEYAKKLEEIIKSII